MKISQKEKIIKTFAKEIYEDPFNIKNMGIVNEKLQLLALTHSYFIWHPWKRASLFKNILSPTDKVKLIYAESPSWTRNVNNTQHFRYKLLDYIAYGIWAETPDNIFMIGYTAGSLKLKLLERLKIIDTSHQERLNEYLEEIKREHIVTGVIPLYKGFCTEEDVRKVVKGYRSLLSLFG